jgi:hypothetical protein
MDSREFDHFAENPFLAFWAKVINRLGQDLRYAQNGHFRGFTPFGPFTCIISPYGPGAHGSDNGGKEHYHDIPYYEYHALS